MVRVAVCQHVAHEILGTLHPMLKDAGIRIRYVNYGRADHPKFDMRRYDALIVLGGPMGVYECDLYPHLGDEIACIRTAIDLQKPVLGICLGAQLVAAALGAEVRPAGVKEIGWYDVHLTPEGRADPVLGSFQERQKIFQWHGDTYTLPAGAVRLASSALVEQQAFRYGDRVYGLQFHLEVDKAQIERWLRLPVNLREIEPLGGALLVDKIRAENKLYLPQLLKASRSVFQALIDLIGRG